MIGPQAAPKPPPRFEGAEFDAWPGAALRAQIAARRAEVARAARWVPRAGAEAFFRRR